MRRRFELFQFVPPSSRMLVGKVYAYTDFCGFSGSILNCSVEGNTIRLVYKPNRHVAKWINRLKVGMPFRWEGYGGVLDGVLEDIETHYCEPDIVESVLKVKIRGGARHGKGIWENSYGNSRDGYKEKQDVRELLFRASR